MLLLHKLDSHQEIASKYHMHVCLFLEESTLND